MPLIYILVHFVDKQADIFIPLEQARSIFYLFVGKYFFFNREKEYEILIT